jgi:saccharopine dehydrogenase-like NADP-dependent oxidoreductase
MKKIAVFGLGKVGTLVGTLLAENFEVVGFDKLPPHYDFSLNFKTEILDVSDTTSVTQKLQNFDTIVSALPFFLNKPLAKIAHELKLHYFDLTEDVPTTSYIQELAKTAETAMVPQCGLAPGFIGIMGYDLTKSFDRLRDVELRVGALPRYPNGLLAYSFTWSSHGVLNEYLNDAEVIHNGVRKMVPSLEGIEYISIEGQEFEAFATSGGLGTLCETLEGKVDTLNYKTMRYPGHGKLMRFLMYELIMKEDLETLDRIMTNAKPPVDDDVVYVYAVVEGWRNEKIARAEYWNAFYPKNIAGQQWRAISWTTAAAIAATVELVAAGKLPQKGFIKQEEIDYNAFLETQSGALYKS